MKNRIYIITGSSKSGKTTQLMSWVTSQKYIDGILQPVIEGKRFLYHISSRTLVQLEINNDKESINIGKYKFSLQSLRWANNKLIESLTKDFDWIVVDEIGPLELMGQGFDESIRILLNHSKNQKIIFVIRKNILEKALKYYSINDFEIINTKQLKKDFT